MLTKCLEHEIPYVREAAADALGELGEHAAASIPAVMELLQHRDRGIRKAAAYALGQSNSRDPRHPDTIAPVLTKCLEHEIPYVREAAADALGELGEHAAASIPAVMELLQHRDRGIRKAAAYALGQSNSRDPRHPDTIAGGSNRVSDIFIDKNSVSCS